MMLLAAAADGAVAAAIAAAVITSNLSNPKRGNLAIMCSAIIAKNMVGISRSSEHFLNLNISNIEHVSRNGLRKGLRSSR